MERYREDAMMQNRLTILAAAALAVAGTTPERIVNRQH
jgi:hypothetical protein